MGSDNLGLLYMYLIIMFVPATISIMPNIAVRFLFQIFLDVYAPTCAPTTVPAATSNATGKFTSPA